MPVRTSQLAAIASLLALALLSACGYTLQNSKSPLLEKEGIRRVYIAKMVNDSFKPGVESIVYNALVRTLASHGRVKLVSRVEDADAVLSGHISGAGYSGVAATSITAVGPYGYGPFGQVAYLGATNQLAVVPNNGTPPSVISEYSAYLSCDFTLTRAHITKPGQSSAIWGSAFSQSKVFPAYLSLDVQGTTTPLLNESQFDRALQDMAKAAMEDLHESMLAMF